jgi:serine/threonine protein phosphatase 1
LSTVVTATDWQPSPKPVSRPLYAIGDVHGAAPLLDALQARLRDLNASGRLVYLGDLIDPTEHVTGADCARVLDLVANGAGCRLLEEHVLMGNHDQLFMLALNAARTKSPLPYDAGLWTDQGALKTADAWGIGEMGDERHLAATLWDRMSASQRAVFERMETVVEHDDYLLVHAGVCDYLPLTDQLATDWRSVFPRNGAEECEHPLWMRLHSEDVAPKGRVQVVGHSARRHAFIGNSHIGIDTAAKFGGPLTMIEVIEGRMRFHQARP